MTTPLHQFDSTGPRMRYCGTLFMPAVYASEQSFMDFFEKTHPRFLGGNVILRPHSPVAHPALVIPGNKNTTESCLDVWVACQEDNPGVAAALPAKVIERWRAQTSAIRNDELGVFPPLPLRRQSRPR